MLSPFHLTSLYKCLERLLVNINKNVINLRIFATIWIRWEWKKQLSYKIGGRENFQSTYHPLKLKAVIKYHSWNSIYFETKIVLEKDAVITNSKWQHLAIESSITPVLCIEGTLTSSGGLAFLKFYTFLPPFLSWFQYLLYEQACNRKGIHTGIQLFPPSWFCQMRAEPDSRNISYLLIFCPISPAVKYFLDPLTNFLMHSNFPLFHSF